MKNEVEKPRPSGRGAVTPLRQAQAATERFSSDRDADLSVEVTVRHARSQQRAADALAQLTRTLTGHEALLERIDAAVRAINRERARGLSLSHEANAALAALCELADAQRDRL